MLEKDYYSVPAVSNSGLKYINPDQGGSPKKYKAYIFDRVESKETPSLKNGKLIHLYVEDPSAFIISDIVLPSAMLVSWVEEVYRSMPGLNEEGVIESNTLLKLTALNKKGDRYKSTKDEVKIWETFKGGLEYLKHLVVASTHIVMDRATSEIVKGATNSIMEHDTARNLLFHANPNEVILSEIGVFWKNIEYINEEKVVLECKALLDKVKIDYINGVAIITDLKTTSKPVSNFYDTSESYHYYRQLAFYGKALKNYLSITYPDVKHWTIEYNIVAVETYGIYECAVFEVDMDYIEKGIEEVNFLLSLVSYHYLFGDWINTLQEKVNNGKRLLTCNKQKKERDITKVSLSGHF